MLPASPRSASLPASQAPVVLRFAGAEDAAGVAAIYAPNIEGSVISFEEVAPTPEQMRQRISSTLAQTPWLVCEREGQLLGYAYASPHAERAAYRWSLNVSVYVAPGCRRQGIGRALYASLFALLQLAGYHAAHAGITLPNPASVGLHESLGFVPVGVFRAVGFKLGAWHDVGWWQRELLPRVGIPAPPIPLPVLRAEAAAAVAAALATGLVQLAPEAPE